MSYLFRTTWLGVPDLLYFVLLFGGLIALLISLVSLIHGIICKKDKTQFRTWIVAILISVILIMLTMTGKIAPYSAFGG